MEINYNLTEQDFLDFNSYHAKQSPAIKRSILKQRLMGPVIFLIAAFLAIRRSDVQQSYWITLFGITSILWFIFYPKYFYWEISRRTSKTLKKKENAKVLGEKTIRLASGKLKEIGIDNEEIASLDSIEKIEETEKHLFIYISPVSAFIVPIEAFEDRESKKEFISKLKELIA